MQQAATYSNISRPSPANNNTGNNTSTAGVVSRSLSSKKSSPRLANEDGFSPIVIDSYDSGAHAVRGRKGSDNGQRKRPAFLNLAPEESVTFVDGQTLHTKRSKDQMRKSSPTVGERFRFTPGEPPVPSLPVIEQPLKSAPPALGQKMSIDALGTSEKSKAQSRESLLDPPRTAPPTGPLPPPPTIQAPSRSPSRSRSPPKSPVKSILRNGSTRESTATIVPHRRHPSASPPKQFQADMGRHDSTVTSDLDFKKPAHSPTPSVEKTFRSTPSHSSLQHPRKQRSTSSVRDQIIMLPESARLRKQASGDILRQQSSSELLGQTGLHEALPYMSSPDPNRYVMGNAFGRQPPGNQSSSSQISRSASYDMLTDAARKRSVADLVHNASIQEEEAQALQSQTRTHNRSASDSRRPAHLKYLNVDFMSDEGHSPTSEAATTPSTLPTPQSQLRFAASESWPLTSTEEAYPKQPPTSSAHHSRHATAERIHTVQVRSSVSPDSTPRASRSITPHTGMSGPRSRSNTLLTTDAEAAGADQQNSTDSQSLHGSVAPSIMSAQWHRSPQERLDIGPRVNHTDPVPWEADDVVGDMESKKDIATKSRTGGKFTGVPNRTSSRGHTLIQPQSPPRSPLLTEGFLTNVKAGLPQDEFGTHAVQAPQMDVEGSSATAINTSFDNQRYDVDGKKLKKDKKKKDSSRPSMKELWGAYKESPSTWYVAQYKRAAAEEQRAAAYGHNVRPSMDHTSIHRSPSMLSSRQSMDRSFSMTSSSGNSNRFGLDKEKKKKKTGFMKSMFSSPNTWYDRPTENI